MAKTTTDNEALQQLRAWVHNLHYNPETDTWHATLKPFGIVEAMSFKGLVKLIEAHVVRELLELVGEAIHMNPDQIKKRSRKREVVDYRIVSAIIILEKYYNIRNETLCRQLGWSNHASVNHALKQADVAEIDRLLKKVYRLHPELRTGKVEILNKNPLQQAV